MEANNEQLGCLSVFTAHDTNLAAFGESSHLADFLEELCSVHFPGRITNPPTFTAKF